MNLVLDQVGKIYSRREWVVHDFSLELNSGILGLLGPKDAGKTALMLMLATITKPTKGKVSWNGDDIHESPSHLRQMLGYIPEPFDVPPMLTALEFLHYIAALRELDRKAAVRRIDELLQLVELTDHRKQLLGEYSREMKLRLAVAQAFLNYPNLILIDEPTGGLEPEGRERFRQLLRRMISKQLVIVAASNVLDLEGLTTDIAVIIRGSLLNRATPDDLKRSVQGKVWEWVIPVGDLGGAQEQFWVFRSVVQEDKVRVRAISPVSPGGDARPVEPTLEDALQYYVSKTKSIEGE